MHVFNENKWKRVIYRIVNLIVKVIVTIQMFY